MRLSEGLIGKSYLVKEIALELPVKRRLEILGMTMNTVVTVMNSKRTGAKIIKVRGTRFALGADFAEKIQVEQAKEGELYE